jgi:hypothetical protein
MWRAYPHERLVLVLVAVSALAVINPLNPQDVTRVGLSRSLAEHGAVDIDAYHTLTSDRAYRKGHWYSDKAPGVSILAIPTVEGLRAIDAATGDRSTRPIWKRVGHIWIIRLLTGGLGLLAATFLLGRAAEALRPGFGATVAITFALGTIAGPLGPTTFGHVLAAALGFGAFVAAASGRSRLPLAGALAAAAVLCEYQAALIVVVLAVYVVARHGFRGLLRFCAGGVPLAVGLGLYNWAAFGSPLRLSYKYVSNVFTERQHQGFFGIGTPTWHGAWMLFIDGRGLLWISPVLAAAAVGLGLLWRRGKRLEAGVCIVVTLLFVFADMSYFLPYGGISPGPRFFAPALPFLALGLAEAYHRWPWPTAALALWSFVLTTLDAVTWGLANHLYLTFSPQLTANTVWARAPVIRTKLGLYIVFVSVAVTVGYAGLALYRAKRAPEASAT